jgi:uncharacterized protein YndB with AHSA1/START domain
MSTKLNYKSAVYTVELAFAKSPAEVFNCLINLKKWWPEDFAGDDVQLDSVFDLTVGDGHYSKNRVTDFVPDKKFAWVTVSSNRQSDGFDWTGTRFIFEMTPNGHNTQVSFTYDGVVPENEVERLKDICDMTIKEIFWNYILNDRTN